MIRFLVLNITIQWLSSLVIIFIIIIIIIYLCVCVCVCVCVCMCVCVCSVAYCKKSINIFQIVLQHSQKTYIFEWLGNFQKDMHISHLPQLFKEKIPFKRYRKKFHQNYWNVNDLLMVIKWLELNFKEWLPVYL